MRHAIELVVVGILTVAVAQAADDPAEPQSAANSSRAASTKTNSNAAGADAQPAPAVEGLPPASGATPLTATVVSVEGPASYIVTTEEAGEWQPLKTGDELSELTVIRTGLGAKVVLELSDRGEITIRNATKVGIASFRQDAGRQVTTRLGLKYGSIHAEVDSTQGPNDFKVRTPVATLSVGGTGGGIGFSYRGLGLSGSHGSWQVTTPSGNTNVGAGQSTDENATPSGNLANAARNPRMGDPFGGLTQEEIDNLLLNGGGRGIFGFVGNGYANTMLFMPGMYTNYSPPSGGSSGDNGDGGNGGGDGDGGDDGGEIVNPPGNGERVIFNDFVSPGEGQ